MLSWPWCIARCSKPGSCEESTTQQLLKDQAACIRFQVDGCLGELQRAALPQLCCVVEVCLVRFLLRAILCVVSGCRGGCFAFGCCGVLHETHGVVSIEKNLCWGGAAADFYSQTDTQVLGSLIVCVRGLKSRSRYSPQACAWTCPVVCSAAVEQAHYNCCRCRGLVWPAYLQATRFGMAEGLKGTSVKQGSTLSRTRGASWEERPPALLSCLIPSVPFAPPLLCCKICWFCSTRGAERHECQAREQTVMHQRSVLGEGAPACTVLMPHTLFALCSSPCVAHILL